MAISKPYLTVWTSRVFHATRGIKFSNRMMRVDFDLRYVNARTINKFRSKNLKLKRTEHPSTQVNMVFRTVLNRLPGRASGLGGRKEAKKARPLIIEADAARDRGDWRAAAQSYRLAVEVDPTNAGIFVQLGHALKESGSVREAEAQYRKAISLDPANADTYVQLGHVLKLQGDIVGATAAYQQAYALNPSLDAAIRELESIGVPDLASAKAGDMDALVHRRKETNAVHANLKRIDPLSIETARARVKHAFGIEPTQQLTRTMVVEAFQRAGAAETIMLALREAKPIYAQAHGQGELALLARFVAASLIDPRLARRYVPALADLDDQFKASVQSADTARDEGRWGEAEFHYWRALSLFPKHMGYRVQYAHMLKEAGKFTDAEVHYRHAFAQGETGSGIINFIEFTQMKRGGSWSQTAMRYVLEYWSTSTTSNVLGSPLNKDCIDTLYPLFFHRNPTSLETAELLAMNGSIGDMCRNSIKSSSFGAANRDLLHLIAQKGQGALQ